MIIKNTIENRRYDIELIESANKPVLHYLEFDSIQQIETTFFEYIFGLNIHSETIYSIFNSPERYIEISNSGFISNKDSLLATEAFGVTGNPTLKISFSDDRPFYALSIIQDVHALLIDNGFNPEIPHAIKMKVEGVYLEGYLSENKGKRFFSDETELHSMEGFGFSFLKPEHLIRENEGFARLSKLLLNFPFGAQSYFMSIFWGDEKGIARIPDPETTFKKISLEVYLFDDCVIGY